ncbi:odorant receptor Or1-like [Venturia canescens]|uniref:odorant receptor Or1-like n=1 Tax=Venturia canescens TaxID=32260 RepID=UPI001C9CD5E1|nr:odorant receptor Or1-like [Venturia canescens]
MPWSNRRRGASTGAMDGESFVWRRLPRIEPNKNLKISLELLSYIGNWPPEGKARKLYYVYSFLYFTLVISLYLLVQMAFIVSVWGDVERTIAGSFLLMTNTGNAYKMIVVLTRQRRIRKLVKLVAGEMFSGDNERHERVVSRYTWLGIFHHATYQSLGAVSIACWALGSVVDILKAGVRRLPVESSYPYDVAVSPNFEITCAQQILGQMILCLHNIALDTLVTNFLNVACCQLEILRLNVQAIGHDGPADRASSGDNERARKQLNACVEHNKAIISFKKEIQEIFGTSILFQCFVNCAIICLAAFHITQMEVFAPAEILGTGLYLCGMTYQIFIYCWHGNELALHSERVAFAAYSGNWWKFDRRFNSTLKILMIRSQRPLFLTAGKIMIVSLETFTSILRMSYSLFTVLQSSTNDDD